MGWSVPGLLLVPKFKSMLPHIQKECVVITIVLPYANIAAKSPPLKLIVNGVDRHTNKITVISLPSFEKDEFH